MRGALALLIATGCAGKTGRISASELHRTLEERPAEVVVVDVRSDREWAGRKGHVPGAQHLAWPGVKEQADEIEVDPGQTVVLVCFTGHRSQWAMEAVEAATGAEVVDLRGGMMAWWRKKLPTEVEPAQ